MKARQPAEMVQLVPGLAVPEYMAFILEYCEPVEWTKRAIEAGHLLRIEYHPPYLQLRCKNPEKVVEEAKKRGLRIYRGKHHITVTDTIYSVRIYLEEAEHYE